MESDSPHGAVAIELGCEHFCLQHKTILIQNDPQPACLTWSQSNEDDNSRDARHAQMTQIGTVIRKLQLPHKSTIGTETIIMTIVPVIVQ